MPQEVIKPHSIPVIKRYKLTSVFITKTEVFCLYLHVRAKRVLGYVVYWYFNPLY